MPTRYSQNIPVYPSFARSIATCLPMPREAPITRATGLVDMIFLWVVRMMMYKLLELGDEAASPSRLMVRIKASAHTTVCLLCALIASNDKTTRQRTSIL